MVLTKIDKCKLIKKPLNCSEWGDEILFLHADCKAFIEKRYNRIRIDSIVVSSEKEFETLMNSIVKLAMMRGVNMVVFDDSLTKENYQRFLNYGFKEVVVLGDVYNQHLYLEVKGEVK